MFSLSASEVSMGSSCVSDVSMGSLSSIVVLSAMATDLEPIMAAAARRSKLPAPPLAAPPESVTVLARATTAAELEN